MKIIWCYILKWNQLFLLKSINHCWGMNCFQNKHMLYIDMEVGVMKTEAEKLRKKRWRACLWADREEEGQREQTVTEGVSMQLSWASKPITGDALIEAALEGLIYTNSPLIHWSGDGSVSTTNCTWMAICIHYAVNGTSHFKILNRINREYYNI